MPELNRRAGRDSFDRRWRGWSVFAFSLLLALSIIGAGCAGPRSGQRSQVSAAEREASLRQIAADFARNGDLARAQAALDKLQLANPAQLLVTLAEQEISQGRPPEEVAPLARLAEALGARSPKLAAYLSPTAPPTRVTPPPVLTPPIPTLVPTQTPPPATPTSVPTPTPLPPTQTPTPQPPRVVAQNTVNLRGGPGTNYGLVGQLQAGQELEIVGRSAGSDWWRLAWGGAGQAWVAGTVVQVLGPIDTVPVARDIPPPPPTSTPAPPPTAAPPTQPPRPSVDYVIKSLRLRPVGQDAQRCDGGDHNIFVLVVDPAGSPLNGVRVREIFTKQIQVTGAQGKGPGRVEFDIYRGGGGQLEIVDEAGNRISEPSRGMSADWPDFDLMWAAGYCNCKPHPDEASCRSELASHAYLFAVGHYVYEVVYQRTY